VLENPMARRFFFYMIIMLAAILGQDVLLEPYGGEAFGLSVSATTRITSIWGGCMLLTLVLAGWLERKIDKRNVARIGAWLAIAGFAVIAGSGVIHHSGTFYGGVMLLGFGTGLSTVSNLSLMLDMTTSEVGLYIGAWGVSNAMARLLGSVMSGVVRDVIAQIAHNPVLGYITVFVLQAMLLLFSLAMLARIDVQQFRRQTNLSAAERAALMHESS
jgi:BCD family chlorophyll transporter-like MFS transporter